MGFPQGSRLLVLLLTAYLGFTFGRSLSVDSGRSAVSITKPHEIRIFFSEGFSIQGVRCFSDDIDLFSAIKLTNGSIQEKSLVSAVGTLRILDGQRLMLIKKNNIVTDVACDWMPAAQRIALGIPLHPDRMQPTDWKVLPGIGEKLAWKIENDRQINGDFGSLNALTRVPGIGIRSIRNWQKFFEGL